MTIGQLGPFVPSVSFENSVSTAIHSAIEAVRSYVDQATKDGHSFDAKWLVTNPHY
jgi:hypothetical protein